MSRGPSAIAELLVTLRIGLLFIEILISAVLTLSMASDYGRPLYSAAVVSSFFLLFVLLTCLLKMEF